MRVKRYILTSELVLGVHDVQTAGCRPADASQTYCKKYFQSKFVPVRDCLTCSCPDSPYITFHLAYLTSHFTCGSPGLFNITFHMWFTWIIANHILENSLFLYLRFLSPSLSTQHVPCTSQDAKCTPHALTDTYFYTS